MKSGTMTVLLTLLILIASCNKDSDIAPVINPGNDPNFTIVVNSDAGMDAFNRKVVVFGIDIYAAKKVEDAKLLHAANILAQYLDNDENGEIDNPEVVDAMKSSGAFMVMWNKESDLRNVNPPAGREGQDLGNEETRPEWHASQTGAFDASLEEVWHIITHTGYANAYPDVFGEKTGTELARAMDKARGGNFSSIPDQYPSGAWYTYDDKTCDYSCQATEYIYWAMTSMLGAQKNRLQEIGHEWKLNTREKVQSGDPDVFSLLTNEVYGFPKKLPDGTYRR